MSERRIYPLFIAVNGRRITEVVIDPHYQERHPDIDDGTILALVQSLNGGRFEAKSSKNGWEYFESDSLRLRGKTYRLVWCLEQERAHLGVINCFRRR